jgi:hypothetical protein
VHGSRLVLLTCAVGCPLVLAQAANAALWVHAKSTTVKAGSHIVLNGVTGGMPIYLVPVSAIKKFPSRCDGCAPYTPTPPSQPLVFLGRGPKPDLSQTRFALTVPKTVPPGRFRVALYCASCYEGPGGSLIIDTRSFTLNKA